MVDYSVGQNIYMLPSDMNLKIKTGTVGTIIKFSYLMVTLVWGITMRLTLWRHLRGVGPLPTIKSHRVTQTATRPKRNSNVLSHAPAISQKNQEPRTITHKDEKIAFVLFLTSGFAIWNIFQ